MAGLWMSMQLFTRLCSFFYLPYWLTNFSFLRNYNPVERRSKGGKDRHPKGQKASKSLQANTSFNSGSSDAMGLNKTSSGQLIKRDHKNSAPSLRTWFHHYVRATLICSPILLITGPRQGKTVSVVSGLDSREDVQAIIKEAICFLDFCLPSWYLCFFFFFI